MSIIGVVLLICAAICFLLATIPLPSRVNLIALGLLFWVIATLVGNAHLTAH